MMSAEGKAARMRRAYTGEPKAAALHFYRQAGMRFGLVPDAVDTGQQSLEALLFQTLAHPGLFVEGSADPGSVWGLSGASPYPDRLTLWPAPGQAASLLARWLPIRTRAGDLGGIPGLRAAALSARPRDTLTLALAGQRAHVELRAEPHALQEAADLVRGAGLDVLWDADTASRTESEALSSILSELSVSQTVLWSRALRRLGLARDAFAAWRQRDPIEAELEGPHPTRIAARPSGPTVALRGVVAVLSSDGRGGRGCTTASYMLAAAAAVGGARVGIFAGDDPSNLPRLLGLGHAPFTGWRDASSQLGGDHHLQVAVLAESTTGAAEQLAAARAEFDVLVVDVGNAFQHPGLAAQADAVVVLAPDQVPWYDDEIIDERSPRVQIWSHLTSLNQQEWSSRRPGPELFVSLDEAFAQYVVWRADQEGITLPREGDADARPWDGEADRPGGSTADPENENEPEMDADQVGDDWDDELDLDGEDEEEDGWVEPYDPEASDDVEDFWAFGSVGGSAWTTLPPEDKAPHLGTWRTDFLQILAPEGERRHPEAWPDVMADWAERSRVRNLQRVPAGFLSRAEQAAAQEQMVAADTEKSLQRWDEELWQRESAAWLAANAELRDDVGHAEDDQIWTLHHPRPSVEVAAELRSLVRSAPLGRPIVYAVTQPREDLDRHLLEQVGIALQREQGIDALTVIPRHMALRSWVRTGRVEPPALAIGWTLAEATLDALEHRDS
ncbi:hypothetical protein [Streptomyces prunicolor]|uniref:hypothetical protein n=1 Tax=Streptomyces prunicolor TaxID=67348 RepID=UPI0003825E78|nr:hypothetical protein [Streptomyces prunicolor]